MGRRIYHVKGVRKEGPQAAEDFVGPLDLILHLLKKNKLAIRDVPLAEILEQFLAWMEARRAMDLEVAGEFIAMASQLMLLKTKMLLAQEDRQAQAEMEELIASLEARQRQASYRRVLTVLPQLEEAYRQGRAAFSKGPEPAFAQRVYRYEHSKEELTRAIERWHRRRRREIPPALEEFRGVVRPEPYRVEAKSAEVLTRLEGEGPLSLAELLRPSRSRSEATATFLALLELCRGGKVHLEGDMENPVISRIPT